MRCVTRSLRLTPPVGGAALCQHSRYQGSKISNLHWFPTHHTSVAETTDPNPLGVGSVCRASSLPPEAQGEAMGPFRAASLLPQARAQCMALVSPCLLSFSLRTCNGIGPTQGTHNNLPGPCLRSPSAIQHAMFPGSGLGTQTSLGE